MILLKLLLLSNILFIEALTLFENDKSSDVCQSRFIIIVDGGSSGTRLHVFQFEKDKPYPGLIETTRFKSKIALSKFSNLREDWSLMRIMINNLTASALNVVPEECIKETPIYVQVTAGVRQIDQSMSNKILNHIRSILLKSKLNFKPEYVDILSTATEGRLAWVSINFLLERLQFNNEQSRKTVGILDLGGGSTQISFETSHPDLLSNTVKMVLFGRDYQVYAAGYDYMGINEIRIKYLNAENCFQAKCQNQTVRSQCIDPNIKGHFHFGNRTLVIGGRAINKCRRFCFCLRKGIEMIKSVKSIRQYYSDMEFVGISAYYYIITDAIKITKRSKDGLLETSILDIILEAMKICKEPKKVLKLDSFQHFSCLDMSYLVSLLHNGYGYEWYDKIVVSQKVKGISLSWALGYAISIL